MFSALFHAKRYHIETIELASPKREPFGFGIINHHKGGVKICDIQEGGVAAKDGRLKNSDRLLQINDTNVEHYSMEDAARLLQNSRGAVRLVIARLASDPRPNQLLTLVSCKCVYTYVGTGATG